jgi:adenosylmethionine-8-amino-7-oxononanoate aminotransferase
MDIRNIEGIHAERLAAIRNHRAVGDVRSIGSIGAVELRAQDAGYLWALKPKLYEFFMNAGVLLRPLGNILYVLPPYVISSQDLHFIYDRITGSLALADQ